MTSKGESERRALPARVGWVIGPSGEAGSLVRRDGERTACFASFHGRAWYLYADPYTSSVVLCGCAADEDDARAAAEAALWARDGFGVGEVRGLVLGDEWTVPVGLALDAPKSCPMALPGLPGLWTLTRVSSARPITVDAVRACERDGQTDMGSAHTCGRERCPAPTDADAAPLTHALDAEGNALCPYDPATLAYVSPRHERVTCPACIERVQATVEPAPLPWNWCPTCKQHVDIDDEKHEGGEVRCIGCGAWYVVCCEGDGSGKWWLESREEHDAEDAEPAPREPSAPTDADELARLLRALAKDAEVSAAVSGVLTSGPRGSIRRLARGVRLLLVERERIRAALRPCHAPTRDEGSYERTLARVLAEFDRLRADDGARTRGILAKNHELTDALGAAEEERDALRARYRETLLAFDEAAPDALRALRQRQHDAAKPSPEMAEKIRADLRKKPAVKKEDGDGDK